MVKLTQKTTIIVAAVLLLLLSFGLGFYAYPLIDSLDGDRRIGSEPRGKIGTGAVDGGSAALEAAPDGETDSLQTASNQAGSNTSGETAADQSNNTQSTEAQGSEENAATQKVDLSGIEADDLTLFLEAWRALERDFFGEQPDSRQQIYGAIRGLLQAHDDPYTFFIEPETNEVEQGNLRGSFGGIGAHVQPTELGFVLDPIRDNPAQQAGIKTGDFLVQIDETEVTKDTPVDDVVAMIRGTLDTDVVLGLLRPANPEGVTEEALADAEPLTITVTRAEIRTPSVDWRIITGDDIPVDLLLERLRSDSGSDGATTEATTEPVAEAADAESEDESVGEQKPSSTESDVVDEKALPEGISEEDVEGWKRVRIGYIQHRIYSDRSPDEMRQAIRELQDDGADRFIVDLRGNPGGPVTSVVQVTDLWVEEPLIMFEEKADGNQRDFEASEETLVQDEPVIIVVDGGTASASEIFAGALRDHDRAIVLGEKTFGKGSVQVIHVLPDSSSMHITNARWFTPDGHKIDGTGLLPDIEIEPGADSLQEAVLQILDLESK